MAVNKNFVIKNGIEVNNDLIFADSSTNRVGLGSTQPAAKLDINGGLEADDVNVSGVTSMAGDFNVGSGGTTFHVDTTKGMVGVGTDSPDYLLEVYGPTSSGTTALYVRGDVRVTGDINVDDISFDTANLNTLTVSGMSTLNTMRATGFATFREMSAQGIGVTNLNVTGVGTINIASITNDLVVGGMSTVNNLRVTGFQTSQHIQALSVGSTQLAVTGVSTFNSLTAQGIGATNVVVSGVATIGNLNVATIDVTGLEITGIATIRRIESVSIGATEIQVSGMSTLNQVSAQGIGVTSLNVSGVGTINTLSVTNGVDIGDGLTVGAALTTVDLNVSQNAVVSGLITATSEEIYTEFDITNSGGGGSTDYTSVTLSGQSSFSFNVTYARQSTGFTLDTGTVASGNAQFNSNSNYYYYVATSGPANTGRIIIFSEVDNAWVVLLDIGEDFTEGNVSNNDALGFVTAVETVTASSETGDSRNVPQSSATIVYPSGGGGGSSAYQFAMTGIGFTANTDNPDLYLERGRNYRFNVNASGHPFWLKTAPVTGIGTTFNDGVTNNGAAVGIITFKVPFNAPNTLYYQCQNHAAMNGHVYVLDAGIGTDVSINTSGIITATKFVGIGSDLTDLNIGISSANDGVSPATEEFIGTGVTNIVFHTTTGTGLSITGVTNGRSDVYISPGASIGLVIALSG